MTPSILRPLHGGGPPENADLEGGDTRADDGGRKAAGPAEDERLPRRSWIALAFAGFLIIGCGLAGLALTRHGVRLHLGSLWPLAGRWSLHLTTWALPALGIAALVVWRGRDVAARLPWRSLLTASWATAAAWTIALSIVGGPSEIGRPIATVPEYLHDVPRIRGLGVGPFLHQFVPHVVDMPPQWTTHVSGHGPLATLVFVWLAQLDLGSPTASGFACILIGTSAVPSVLSTTRLLAGASAARRAAPFVAAAPLALWVGTSADAIFAGVAAAGLCAVAHSASRHGWRALTLGVLGGVLLGAGVFMSYGLVLFGALVLAIVAVCRAARPLAYVAIGVVAVYVAFRVAGFDWFSGFAATRERVMVGRAWQDRPAAYFVFADPAALAITIGPAAIVAGAVFRRPWRHGIGVLPTGAVIALGLAIASNLAKGEVERIYLPFAFWLLPLAALLPLRNTRWWLAAQCGWALAIALVTQLTW